MLAKPPPTPTLRPDSRVLGMVTEPCTGEVCVCGGGGVPGTHVAHDIQALLSVVEPRRPVAARWKLADGEDGITEHRLKPWVYESIHRREILRQHGVTVDVDGTSLSAAARRGR